MALIPPHFMGSGTSFTLPDNATLQTVVVTVDNGSGFDFKLGLNDTTGAMPLCAANGATAGATDSNGYVIPLGFKLKKGDVLTAIHFGCFLIFG